MRMLPLACTLFALLAPLQAQADIYRYVDKYGVEHYTNVQPSDRGWQLIYKNARKSREAARGPRYERPNDAERRTRYDAFIREAALVYQLPETFIRAVMQVESDYQSDAISEDGAMGLMQLMPGTAESMGVYDPFDPRQNVLGGARYLRLLANMFNGDLVLTVAAYNAGQGAVQKYSGVPPFAETRRYVQRVLQNYYSFRSQPAASTAAR
jgi:soluble lytic murein transglycosylase-like protein